MTEKETIKDLKQYRDTKPFYIQDVNDIIEKNKEFEEFEEISFESDFKL